MTSAHTSVFRFNKHIVITIFVHDQVEINYHKRKIETYLHNFIITILKERTDWIAFPGRPTPQDLRRW